MQLLVLSAHGRDTFKPSGPAYIEAMGLECRPTGRSKVAVMRGSLDSSGSLA